MGFRFKNSEPSGDVAAAPSLGGKPVGRNRYYGANDPRGRTGLAAGY
jgi:gamma-glutamyltranspeptidase/glutathione hydrolase